MHIFGVVGNHKAATILSAISCTSKTKHVINFTILISSFPHVLHVVCFLLGNYPASGVYMPTFRNTLSVPSS